MTREEKENFLFDNLYDMFSRVHTSTVRVKRSLELTHVILHKYGHLIDYDPQVIGSGKTYKIDMGVYPADTPVEKVAAKIFKHKNFVQFKMKPALMFLVEFEQDMMKDGRTIMNVYGYFI